MQHSSAIAAAQPREIDWPRFLDLVRLHRVGALVHAGLASAEIACPPAIAAALAADARRDTLLALRNVGELSRIARAFKEQDLPFLSLKGPLLSLELYGDPARRQTVDLDFLLAPDTQPQAAAVMAELGYRMVERHVAGSSQLAAAHVHREHGTAIDLIWSFARHPSRFPLGFGELSTTAREVALAGARIRTPGRANQLLYLCCHGARHRWRWLKWLCDIAQILRGGQIADWPGLLRQARDLGVDRALLQAMRLVATIFALPAPAALAGAGDRTVDVLARHALRGLAIEREPHELPPDHLALALYFLRHQRRWPERLAVLRYLGRRLTLGLSGRRLARSGQCLTIYV